jgi:hypothetical protein
MDAPSFACLRCGTRCPAPGDCARCPGVALLDLRTPSVREMLLDEDRRRAERRKDQLRWASVPVGIVLGTGLSVTWPKILALVPPLPFPNFLRPVLLMILIAAAAMYGLRRFFPAPKHFADLERRD